MAVITPHGHEILQPDCAHEPRRPSAALFLGVALWAYDVPRAGASSSCHRRTPPMTDDWETLSEELQLLALSFLTDPRDRAAFVLTSRAAAGWLAPDAALAFWLDPLFRIAMRKHHGSTHCVRCLSMAPPWRLRMEIPNRGMCGLEKGWEFPLHLACAGGSSQRRLGGACQCAEAVDKLVARQYIKRHLPTELELEYFNTQLADLDAQLQREELGDGSSEFRLRAGGPVLRAVESKEHVYLARRCPGRPNQAHLVRWPVASAVAPTAAQWLFVPKEELKKKHTLSCQTCELGFVVSFATAPLAGDGVTFGDGAGA